MLDKIKSLCYNIKAVESSTETQKRYAGMAELADALASGASLRKEVQVQVLLPAPIPPNRIACSYGSIAQLGEHLPYKQRVIGSSPIVPTKIHEK